MARIPLIITDDHAFTRTGLQHQLEQDGRFDVLGQAANAHETLALARKMKPDLAVIDYVLPDASGLEIVIEMRRWVPDCRCVILTGSVVDNIVGPLLDAQVSGILNKGADPQSICDALAQIAAGEQVVDPVFARAANAAPPIPLSPRELEVLIRIARGLSNPKIAEDLSLSAKTVESHRASLMRKLDVTSTATLMVKAARAGLIDL